MLTKLALAVALVAPPSGDRCVPVEGQWGQGRLGVVGASEFGFAVVAPAADGIERVVDFVPEAQVLPSTDGRAWACQDKDGTRRLYAPRPR